MNCCSESTLAACCFAMSSIFARAGSTWCSNERRASSPGAVPRRRASCDRAPRERLLRAARCAKAAPWSDASTASSRSARRSSRSCRRAPAVARPALQVLAPAARTRRDDSRRNARPKPASLRRRVPPRARRSRGLRQAKLCFFTASPACARAWRRQAVGGRRRGRHRRGTRFAFDSLFSADSAESSSPIAARRLSAVPPRLLELRELELEVVAAPLLRRHRQALPGKASACAQLLRTLRGGRRARFPSRDRDRGLSSAARLALPRQHPGRLAVGGEEADPCRRSRVPAA